MVDNPIDLVIKSQQLAMKVATDSLRAVRDTAVTGMTQPDELLSQVAALGSAVTGLAGAIGGLASATAQPLQEFIVRQRELADTVATLADAQAELAGVVAKLAERHAEAVTALERLSSPVFAMVGAEPTPRRGRSKPAGKKAPKPASSPSGSTGKKGSRTSSRTPGRTKSTPKV